MRARQPTTYAEGPPPSKFAINGSRGGAFGLLFGLLAFVSIVGGGLWLLFIRRRNQRRRRARLAPMHAAFPARGRGAADDDFELAAGSDKPGHLAGGNEDAWKSTVSLGGGLDDSHLGVDESYRGRWAQSSESVASDGLPVDPSGKPEYSAVRGGQGAEHQ